MNETTDYTQDFLKYLAADRGYSPATTNYYGRVLKVFADFCAALEGSPTWTEVDGDVVRRWMAERRASGTQPQTVKRDLSVLRSFYRYLMLTGAADRSPMQSVRNPKTGKTLPTFVKQNDMDRLFDDVVFPDTFAGRRDLLILLTFYSTGLRISELVGLNRTDVSTAAGELKVTGKRNKQRIVPFGDELRAAIDGYLREMPDADADGALFVSEKGRRLSHMQVRKIVKSYLSLVTTQKKRTPHVLRHTFATVMLNNGADLEAVKELLGHESLNTTQIYTHTTFAELRKAYDAAHPRNADRHDADGD